MPNLGTGYLVGDEWAKQVAGVKAGVMDLDLQVGYQSDTGRVRHLNEDYVGCVVPEDEAQRRTKGTLFLAADGMGGHKAGDVASRKAVEWVTREYYANMLPDNGESLARAFEVANKMLHELAQRDPSNAGLGTTLVALVIHGTPPRATIANVGDSRAYLLRGRRLTQVTDDHSWVAAQVRAGVLTPAQARRHPQRNVITRALGSQPVIAVDLFEMDLAEGDVLLLCTDGVTGELADRQMARILRSVPPVQAAAQLVARANEHGGHDNASAVVVQVGSRATVMGQWLSEVRARLQGPGAWRGTGPRSLSPWLMGLLVLLTLSFLCVSLAGGTLLSHDLVGTGPVAAPKMADILVVAEGQAEPDQHSSAGSLRQRRGVFLVGPVRKWQCQQSECTFDLTMAGEKYKVRLDRQHLAEQDQVLRGGRVRVFGYQDSEDSAVEARLVDVGSPWWALWLPGWKTVYQAHNWDETVWVYSVVDRNPYSPVPMEDLPGLERGTRIVARGRWLEAKEGENMAFVVDAVYYLEGERYVPLMRDGQ